MAEAGVHFDFHRHLANAIDESPHRGSRTYESVRPEYGEGISGFADLVVFDASNDPVLVIEAKRPDGSSSREIDPYSPKVIRQAHDYASELGAPYFATYNGERLVLFRTFEKGRQLLQRSTKSYDIGSVEKFADTLLDEIARLEAEDAKWDSLDAAFIERVNSFHEQITPELQSELVGHLDTDDEFRAEFVSWANRQGFEYDDLDDDEQQEIHENVATQAAYLLINKIIFYKILESSSAYGDDIRPLAVSIHRVRADLQDHFEDLVENVDFEAIFEHDDIYSEIPLDSVSDRVREFIIELDDQDLTQFDSDVIGRIYEGVIPPERRHDMGEYYTPPAICDLITQLTIDDANDVVLDPACGSGGFLVSAYNRKQELLPEDAGSHTQILDQLHGIDINRFPAHLTAINLALQDLTSYTEQVNVEVSDFFAVEPDTMRFGREQAGAEGSTQETGMVEETVGGFDAVVGNPPYIRYQNLGDREMVRAHLSNINAEYLSGQSDIYAYFITHGSQFLSDGGRLGFIVSDRWLDTKYGADLQQFLLDTFKVEAIIQFERQTFEDALVGSSIVILEKSTTEHERQENTTKFVQIQDNMEIDEIVSAVTQDVDADQMIVTDEYRMVAYRQQALYDEQKWSVFFSAPPIYFDLVGSEHTVELQDCAELHTGLKTGANDFYYKRQDEFEELGLDQYVDPLLKASGQVNKIRFSEDDAEEWGILDIHELVETALGDGQEFGDDKTTHLKEWLTEHGHETLAEYIEWGEDQGFHEYSKPSNRDIWFDLETLDKYRPKLLIPDFVWTESRVVWNEAEAVADWQFHNIETASDIDERVLCGILNSRVVWLARELEGRHAGGQGMTRSRMVLYEAEQVTIPDPREMTDEEKEQIVTTLQNLMDREEELDEDAPLDAKEDERDELDRAVLATLGMEDRLAELKQAVRGLVDRRRKEAGEDTEVLVERTDEREVIDLAGVSEARESTTLDEFT